MENGPHSEVQKPAVVEGKKTSRKEWFKRGVSTLIAVVTVLGAFVAWRAQVAGTESGDREADGVRASQAVQEVGNRIIIVVAEHYTAFLDFLRDRKIALSVYQDAVNSPNLTAEEGDKLKQEFVQNLDLAATSKRYFFPGRYLNYDANGDTYDYNLEFRELYAAEQRSRDLEPQKSFDLSDQYNDKVMALLGVLVVLAVSLWLLALSEILGTATRYATGVGGTFFLILGAYSTYLIENSTGPTGGIVNNVWFFSWILGGITLVTTILLLVFSILRQRSKKVAVNAQQPVAYGSTPYEMAPGITGNSPVPVFVPNDLNQPAQYVQPIASPSIVAAEPEDEEEEPFKRLITILIASVALIAAIIAFLQSDAGNQESSANRNLQLGTIGILGTNISGAAASSFDYGATVRVWKELDTLSKAADSFDDPGQAARYAKARDSITQLSPAFDEAYYDPKKEEVPDRYAFDADGYQADVAGLNQKATVQAKLKNDWGAKASAYIAHLTLLAVSLALLGLSLAVSGAVRYIFSGAGVIMVLITLVWAVGLYTQPVKTLSTEAIDAYAEGERLLLSDEAEEAIASYTKAIEIEPGYGTALAARANAHTYLANQLYGNEDYEKADTEYEAAVQDYLTAIQNGRDDVQVNWNLGWIYYLQGKFDDAIRVDEHIEDLDPTVVAPRMNHALALLVQGHYDEAELMYNTSIAKVADQINEAMAGGKQLASDFWYYLDAGVTDLDNLIDRIDGYEYYYTKAPPLDSIADHEETRGRALEMVLKLKSSTASFEYLGKPPEGDSTATIGNFTFETADPESDSSEPTEWEQNFLPYKTKTVTVGFHYSGINQGQTVMFKVYRDTVEQVDYRQTITWAETDAAGDYAFDISDPAAQFIDANAGFLSLAEYSGQYNFPSGDYVIEMYIDYHLVRRGFFQVEFPPAAAPSPGATPTP